MPREWGLHGLPPVGAACAGRQPLRRCGASSPYTGEPKRRRPKPPLTQGSQGDGARSLPCVRGGGRRMPDGRVPPLAVNFLGSLPSLTATRIPSDARSGCRGRRAVRAAPRGCAGRERESGAGAAKVLSREWGLRGLPPVGAACAGREKLSGERLVRRRATPQSAARPAPLTQGSQGDGARSLPCVPEG